MGAEQFEQRITGEQNIKMLETPVFGIQFHKMATLLQYYH